ncbi:hypothetical protein [Glycomyces sp. MUSA5-2]|uniref:hypothetical protein n=1 Tax=Glycomyces sp. MUSA5-2 TaxID=2053002 RepID=UPI0030083157
MSEHDDDQPTWLDESIQELKAASLPGHVGPPMSYHELMAKVDAVKRSRSDQQRMQSEQFTLGADAYEIGVNFLELGRLDRAEHWLQCAARYGLPEATDKLADLNALRAMLVELEPQDLPEHPNAAQVSAGEHRSTASAQSIEAAARRERNEILDRARQDAEQILEDARRQATEILSNAENEAAAAASTADNTACASWRLKSLDLIWQSQSSARLHPVTPIWGVPGSGKSHLLGKLRQYLASGSSLEMARGSMLFYTSHNRKLDALPDVVRHAYRGQFQITWRQEACQPSPKAWFWKSDCSLETLRRYNNADPDRDEFLDRVRDALVRHGADRRRRSVFLDSLAAVLEERLCSDSMRAYGSEPWIPLTSTVHGRVSAALLDSEPGAIEELMFELTG